MSCMYSAILTGDQLEWKGQGPPCQQPVEVTVTVPDDADLLPPDERGRRAAEALEALAAMGGIDYKAWDASRTVLTSANCDFTCLTADERLELAGRLMESVGPEERGWSLSAAQRAELDRRLAEHERDPDEGESWESVRGEISAG
jgi:putative addiction module component (TIGR02574 family)